MANTNPLSRTSGAGLLLLWLLLLPVFVGATELADRNHLPSSDTAPDLAKRVQGQFKSFSDNFRGRVQKGVYLKRLFGLTDEAAAADNGGITIASPWKTAADAEACGWEHRLDFPPWPGILQPPGDPRKAASGLRTGSPEWQARERSLHPQEPGFGRRLDDAFADPENGISTANMVFASYLHLRKWTSNDGKEKKPTAAYYQNVMVPRDGAIVFDMNYSPDVLIRSRKKGDMPYVRHVSDISFFQWMEACEYANVDPRSLRYIFRVHISTPQTWFWAVKALKEEEHSEIPLWENRVTFNVASVQGAYLLATAHGSGAAMLLLQHKAELGMKQITAITIWSSQGAPRSFNTKPYDGYLNMRFTVTDVYATP